MKQLRLPSGNILVVRNDKLGDFMLSWPTLRALKESIPNARITALVRAYTREAAEMCPWVDELLLDPGPDASPAENKRLLSALRGRPYDAVVTLFSTTRVGLLCWRAGIPYRLAPATKLAQIFYNRRVVQRRSQSAKPEWAYNLELAHALLGDMGLPPPPPAPAPFLHFPPEETAALRAEFCREHGLDPTSRLLFVHPGSGGSAVNLSLGQYASLLRKLVSPRSLTVVATAGPGESERARELCAMLGEMASTVLAPAGIRDFARHIAFADLWISGSTGPLHVAGALDVPTAAFYPRHRSATPLRWQTLNAPEHRVSFTPQPEADERDMTAVDLQAAAAQISERFLR